MLDKTGREIPPRLVAVFNRPGLLTMMEKYQALEDDVLSRMSSGDELFVGIHSMTFMAANFDIKNMLKSQMPHAVCDWCDGDGCKACLGKGWLGKFLYDMTPRKE